MQLAFSTLLGMPVTEDQEGEQLGVVSGALFDADHGTLEGLYVLPADTSFSNSPLFLQVQDVLRVGLSIHVRDADRLVSPHDIIRMAPLLNDSRTIIGQRIITEVRRKRIGKCADVIFDTVSFKILHLLPRSFFVRFGRPIPHVDIVEITPKEIIVREPERLEAVPAQQEKEPAISVGELLTPPTT